MSDVTKTERQLYILSLLSEVEAGVTVQEILRFLSKVDIHVNAKTIVRDIDDLSVVNFPVMEEKKGKNVYYSAQKFGLSNIAFSISELVSLYFTKEIMKSYTQLEIGYSAYLMLEKMITQLPKINKEYLEMLNEYIEVSPIRIIKEKSIDPIIMHKIHEATVSKLMIKIRYSAFNHEEETERVVEPYCLEIYDGCYHLVGFCHLRKSIREFRVSRIIDINIESKSFIKPERFYEQYREKRFDKLTGDESVFLKLKFSGQSARYIQEYECEKADRIVKNPDGSILFEKMTTMSPEITKWILGFGPDIDIIEPEALKLEIASIIENMYKKYCNISDG